MKDAMILIVEDDKCLAEGLHDTLTLHGLNSIYVESAPKALEILYNNPIDLIISDINMPLMSGFELLTAVKKNFFDIPILLMTAYGNIADAILAIREGAKDYLLKPFEPNELVQKAKKLLVNSIDDVGFPVAHDQKTINIFQMAKKVSDKQVSVLITGESGTGKEVLAKYIHQNSTCHKKEFIAVNCAAIPENMLEATLFGYKKGAFTGAVQDYPGKFVQAQDSTLLLDEISEIDLNLQAKLLRVLQEREVEAIGSTKTIKLNVRVIATTNKDLLIETKKGRFREDLYYRLAVFTLHWPALRERKKDIIPLANFLLDKHSNNLKIAKPKYSERALKFIDKYEWPGNIREMDNLIQRALILHVGDCIELEDLMQVETKTLESHDNDKSKLSTHLRDHEYIKIQQAMKDYNGNRKLIAEKLGISERTLRYKLAKMREENILEEEVV